MIKNNKKIPVIQWDDNYKTETRCKEYTPLRRFYAVIGFCTLILSAVLAMGLATHYMINNGL